MISVIIPAHNEEAVIARGLQAIVTGAQPDELELIVACNGCTDRTAAIARGFGPPVHVLEVSEASKIAALNAADAVASGFPRFYVDADVVLDLRSIRAMTAVLEQGDVLFATPSLQIDLSRTTWPVRSFYKVWTQLPYNQVGGQVGTGVYALSRAGRARFERFPNVINDDGFVRFNFAPQERTTVHGAVSHVDPPCTLRSLVRAKSRVRTGRRQLSAVLPRLGGGQPAYVTAVQLLRWSLGQPRLWPSMAIYFAVTVAIHWGGRATEPSTRVYWRRDDSRPQPANALNQ